MAPPRSTWPHQGARRRPAAADRRAGRAGLRVATYDGDTPSEERDWVRQHANFVLTNPDMLHHSMLPGHARWASFLRRLRYVVIDEMHHYRGVFGAHVARCAAPAPPGRRALRLRPDLRARVGDGLRPGEAPPSG